MFQFAEAQISIDKDSALSAIESRIVRPIFPDYRINVISLGAKGDSVTNCVEAFRKAMNKLGKNRGGLCSYLRERIW